MNAAGVATVARQEFRLRIRAGRWRVLLAVWFAVLALFTTLLRLALGAPEVDIVNKGVVIFGGLMVFVLGLALLVVPALAAQSVNGDRERGTLATLQVTRLSAGEITLGKFVAAWGTALVFLATTLPLVLYAVSQHGVGLGRVLAVLVVLALLLGTVCAVSLALSALLSRTTTSGVLAYLAVFALTIGTPVLFGLVTASTTETYRESASVSCLPGDTACVGGSQNFAATRIRTDRTWYLLAPNPFVVLADAAPQLPPPTPAELARRQADSDRGVYRQDARDLDPLGTIGRAVRDLRSPPSGAEVVVFGTDIANEPVRRPLWPWGLGADVALAAGALLLTARRLRAPTRQLPNGQRVA